MPKMIKLAIYLDEDGCEAFVKGGAGNINPWQFTVRNIEPDSCFREAPDKHVFLGEVVVSLPEDDKARDVVLTHLDDLKTELMAKTQRAETELQKRRKDLLALCYDITPPPQPDPLPGAAVWWHNCECIITGCGMELGGSFYWGDLFQHKEGGYVFNAVVDQNGKVQTVPKIDDSERLLTVTDTLDVIQTGGVFRIPFNIDCVLNEAAADYICGGAQ